MKSKLKNKKIHISLSISYNDLNSHIKEMLSLQCHLIWVDVITINMENFFNMIWAINEDDQYKENISKSHNLFKAGPPSYMIFYDLNTAQMARIYKEFSIDKNWNLVLIDSYAKIDKPNKSNLDNNQINQTNFVRENKSKKGKNINFKDNIRIESLSTIESNEDIYYICQFKNISDYNNLGNKNKEKCINLLQHSLIDNKLNEFINKTVEFSYGQNYIPIKLIPLVMNVNTITNKHYYYSIIYKPIQRPESCDEILYASEFIHASTNYYVRRGMTDNEFLEIYDLYTSKGWKLIDLKAYKDEKGVTKFSTILTSIQEFYEGSFKLFIGLSKNELTKKIEEMNEKGLYPKILTNYGYVNNNKEHVYAVFFCQYI